VATSSKLGRHWQTEQGNMHHIIDPRTMLPSNNDVVQCTVSGKNVVDCEIWAKVICIMGITAGLELLAEKTENYDALLFTSHKETHFYGREESLPTQWHDLAVDYYHSEGFQHD
jgi:thiamine biosynthesis lipoprotein